MYSAISGLNKNGSGSSDTVTVVFHFLDISYFCLI